MLPDDVPVERGKVGAMQVGNGNAWSRRVKGYAYGYSNPALRPAVPFVDDTLPPRRRPRPVAPEERRRRNIKQRETRLRNERLRREAAAEARALLAEAEEARAEFIAEVAATTNDWEWREDYYGDPPEKPEPPTFLETYRVRVRGKGQGYGPYRKNTAEDLDDLLNEVEQGGYEL
jgi:hypothetical protein